MTNKTRHYFFTLLLTLALALGGMPAAYAGAEYERITLGQKGAVYTTGTGAVTGSFAAITAVEDAVIASLTCPQMTGTLTAIPLPAGTTIYGLIDGYTLTSGKVIAYKR